MSRCAECGGVLEPGNHVDAEEARRHFPQARPCVHGHRFCDHCLWKDGRPQELSRLGSSPTMKVCRCAGPGGAQEP